MIAASDALQAFVIQFRVASRSFQKYIDRPFFTEFKYLTQSRCGGQCARGALLLFL